MVGNAGDQLLRDGGGNCASGAAEEPIDSSAVTAPTT